jgi:hypothetical protein
MKKRVDSLTHIGKLASQMHELGRWRLSAIEHERASLSDDLRAAFEALESSQFAYGAQAKFSMRRIRALQKRLDALALEFESLGRAAQVHGVRARLAEQAAETADKAYRDQEERKELAEIAERALLRRGASQG